MWSFPGSKNVISAGGLFLRLTRSIPHRCCRDEEITFFVDTWEEYRAGKRETISQNFDCPIIPLAVKWDVRARRIAISKSELRALFAHRVWRASKFCRAFIAEDEQTFYFVCGVIVSTELSEKYPAKFGEGSSVTADGLCIGCPKSMVGREIWTWRNLVALPCR